MFAQLCHDALIRKSKLVEDLRAKINDLEGQLKLFTGLPTDLESARRCLQKEQDELARQKSILKSKMAA